ncbi:Mur ligase family protein [Bacteriovorax sp. Seq25_V]|uniref:Mur ligase family protein n=1 Tax=Bacteriovorax sp. Seq25_V TaxID=1201288 RepID=UPI000389FA9A|nr:Mur ligase family protein [Bacteriovorax sp. Seq25_V]EQC44763.1 putative UDP-N-acetylmuramate:L-alanyl-gamma-D-glutamyl-meso-diaminopimelate ligase [Bacteriovorax sp. Seq25_V]
MNLSNYLDFKNLQNKSFKKIFFYRICGTGMGAAACLLKEAGFDVSGADSMFYPPMSTYLETSGIKISTIDKLDFKTLKSEYDLIVVGNVVAGSSQEAREIEECGVPFTSFPTAIGALVLNKKTVIGLSGTHGKTTTTYLGAQVFEKLGEDCGYLIGGVMNGRPPSRLGKSPLFFIESDEYDSAYFEKFSKFQSYCVNHFVITSLEFDHADIFSSIEDIKNEFRKVIPTTSSVVGCSDWPEIISLRDQFKEHQWQDYGKNNIHIIERSEFGTKFKIEDETYKTNLVGDHNIYNLSSIILIAKELGYTKEKIDLAITELLLVKRRQEERGNYRGAIVIDDFAHHPTAVRETLKAVMTKYPKKKINAFLEPGSATARSDIFQAEFLDALKDASAVTIIKPQRPTTAKGRGDLDVTLIATKLNEIGIDASCVVTLEQLQERIDNLSSEENVHLIMSNSSTLGLWSSDFVKNIN